MKEMDNRANFISIEDVIKLLNRENRIGNNSIMSGFDRLDKIKQGWFFGEFSVIGGRPSMGKTGFILSLISNLINKNIPVSLFSATDKLDECFISRILSFLVSNGGEFKKGACFLRVNMAAPLKHIEEGLKRLEQAIQTYQK